MRFHHHLCSYSRLTLHSPPVHGNIWRREHCAAAGNGKSVHGALARATLTLPQISPTHISHGAWKRSAWIACEYKRCKACKRACLWESEVKWHVNCGSVLHADNEELVPEWLFPGILVGMTARSFNAPSVLSGHWNDVCSDACWELREDSWNDNAD